MKKFINVSNLLWLVLSLILCSFMAITLAMDIMFPILLLALGVYGFLKKDDKPNIEAAGALVLGGLIIQLFLLL